MGNLAQFRIKAANAGKVDFELDIQKQHTNRLGTLHGGTLASLVDLGGSLAVASMGRFATGVSTDINGPPVSDILWSKLQLTPLVTYLSAGGKPGDVIRGTAVCEKSKSGIYLRSLI
jgi:acyl-coenzyme A thioesterase 13